MKRWKFFASMLIAGLAVILLLGLSSSARGQVLEGKESMIDGVQRSIASSSVVTRAFSYQGILKEGGSPVNGSRQMAFSLYSDATCSMIVGTSVTRMVAVNDGIFSVDLDFAQAHFDGQALWLKTEVEGTAIGCQPIQTVPYANGLRPGATISSAVSADGNLFHVRSGMESGDEGILGAKISYRTALGYPVGIYAYAYDYGSVGVWGVSDSQFGWGVNGVAEGQNSIGVRGIASNINSVTYGVYGEDASPDGYGGYFLNTAISDSGWALAAEGRHGAIITGTDGTALYASGAGDSPIGDDGVRGIHSGDGVVGESTGTGNLDNGLIGFSEGGYGVYGFSNGINQYGGYFSDPIYVNGGCTGCTMSYVARNSSQNTLLKGDAVRAAGVDASLAGAQTPVIQVMPADSGDSVLGIVVGRTGITLIEPGTDDVQPGAHYGPVGGSAEPGDYLVIVVQGMAQVRLDPAAEIQAGDVIQAGADGARLTSDTTSFGMVLDGKEENGLVWVLVGFD